MPACGMFLQRHSCFSNEVHHCCNQVSWQGCIFSIGSTFKVLTKSEPEVVRQNVVLDVGWGSVSMRCVPIDSTGWQFTQTRRIVAVQTSSGSVCLIPMGKAHVSLVNFEPEVAVGACAKKTCSEPFCVAVRISSCNLRTTLIFRLPHLRYNDLFPFALRI